MWKIKLLPFYINRNRNSKLFHSHSVSVFLMTLSYHNYLLSPSISHTLGLSLLHHHGHRSPSSLFWIKHYNIAIETEKYLYFYFKKLSIAGMGMRRVYSNPLGTGIGFDFSSPPGISWVTVRYMGVGYGDGEGKTRPNPAPLPCLHAAHRSAI